MAGEPLDLLLYGLSQGDAAAVEEIFRTYEPILRMVVRRQLSKRLRVKFDSVDVVQSVWVDLLRGIRHKGWRFASAEHLKAYLITMTRHRFFDRCAQQRRALEHERFMPSSALEAKQPASRQPTPSEMMQAHDVWDRMLSLCPPGHHEVLHLKRQGLKLTEIAKQTGLHSGSVRRILYSLAKRFADPQTETCEVDDAVSEVAQ